MSRSCPVRVTVMVLTDADLHVAGQLTPVVAVQLGVREPCREPGAPGSRMSTRPVVRVLRSSRRGASRSRQQRPLARSGQGAGSELRRKSVSRQRRQGQFKCTKVKNQ